MGDPHEFRASEPAFAPPREADPDVNGMLLAAMLDQMSDLAFYVDMAGRLVLWNRTAAGQMPWLRAGMGFDERFRRVALYAPGEAERLPKERAPVWRAMAGEAVAQEELIVEAGGDRRTFLVSATPIRHGGRQAGVLAVGHDITLRRRAEEALRASEARWRGVVENAPAFIAIMDMDRRLVFLNRGPDGADPAALLGRDTDTFVGPASHARVAAAREEVDRTRRTVRYEIEVPGPDGRTRWYDVSLGPVVDGGEQVGRVAIAIDITDRHEVEHLKNEFMSVVSHELRTPLTTIRAPLLMLKHGLVDPARPEGRELLDIACESVERMTRLVADIFDLDRLQSGRLPMRPAPVHAETVVHRAAEAMGAPARKAGALILVSGVPDLVMADQDRVMQVLCNLIDNALKASPVGGKVRVSQAREGAFVRTCVADEGGGIPPELREAVFERFRQLAAANTRRSGGAGLGLAICRQIVEQLGGHIWVAEAPGPGATLCFTLPVA